METVKDPTCPFLYNRGFYGDGIYKSKGNTSYRTWYDMFVRCYDTSFQEKESTYIGCEVCKEWYSYQEFAKWFEENYVEGYQLDKDILVKGNKVYSPETCCFVPREINLLLINGKKCRGSSPLGMSFSNGKYVVRLSIYGKLTFKGRFHSKQEAFNMYKLSKESYIRDVANKYKDVISEKVYNALMKYEVEITD